MAKRPDTAEQARRLLALLPLLKRGETIPIADLARKVGCTAEEVAADLATITLCGVPPFDPSDLIELDIEGGVVTVYIEPPALDRPLRLTPAEATALAAALEAADYDPDGPLLGKLLAAASADVSATDLERTVRAGAGPGGIADIYAILARAADEHRSVRIMYFTGSTGRVSDRVVHPWALAMRHGVWYLVAFCERAGEERVFRIDRIRSAEPTSDHFEPPAVVSFDVAPTAANLPIAEVHFAPGADLPDEIEWPGATFAPSEGGGTIVRVPYQSTSWIARRVAARLGAAEVASPTAVRDAVLALAQTTLRDSA